MAIDKETIKMFRRSLILKILFSVNNFSMARPFSNLLEVSLWFQHSTNLKFLVFLGLKLLTLCKPKNNISWQALNNKFEILKKTPEDVKSAQVPCVNVFRLVP